MPFEEKKGKRSPIKDKPLRNPGESLERELERLYEEEIFLPVIARNITNVESCGR